MTRNFLLEGDEVERYGVIVAEIGNALLGGLIGQLGYLFLYLPHGRQMAFFAERADAFNQTFEGARDVHDDVAGG